MDLKTQPETPENPVICILPRLTGVGGPASFQGRLVSGLQSRGYKIVFDPQTSGCSVILVIGGPLKLIPRLIKAQKQGIRIVQRLNGRNWLHRKRQGGVKYFLRAEMNNLALTYIRNQVADRIVYQSFFAKDWWTQTSGNLTKPEKVIYNAVDLEYFSPPSIPIPHVDPLRLLVVEGHLSGGYEHGLENAVTLSQNLVQSLNKQIELQVVGETSKALIEHWNSKASIPISWAGTVSKEQMPNIYRSAHLMFSADLNPACPNSVIEALACGLPVVGFKTGALSEVVGGAGGRIADYGSNYWNLEPPDHQALLKSAVEIISDLPAFQKGARLQAESQFNLQVMVQKYLDFLF